MDDGKSSSKRSALCRITVNQNLVVYVLKAHCDATTSDWTRRPLKRPHIKFRFSEIYLTLRA